MICSVSSHIRRFAEYMEFDSFMKRAGKGEAFFSERCALASPLSVKKLTIEIEGSGKGALTHRTKIFADGKQLPLISHFSMDARSDSAHVDIRMSQSTPVIKGSTRNEKGEINRPISAVRSLNLGKGHIAELISGHVFDRPIEINWVKDYDDPKRKV